MHFDMFIFYLISFFTYRFALIKIIPIETRKKIQKVRKRKHIPFWLFMYCVCMHFSTIRFVIHFLFFFCKSIKFHDKIELKINCIIIIIIQRVYIVKLANLKPKYLKIFIFRPIISHKIASLCCGWFFGLLFVLIFHYSFRLQKRNDKKLINYYLAIIPKVNRNKLSHSNLSTLRHAILTELFHFFPSFSCISSSFNRNC